MASAPVLADPSVMTAQERTDELVASIERDDLLAVLLVLSYCDEDEVHRKASTFSLTPLETAVLFPTTRTPVHQLVAECLLHRGANAEDILQRPPTNALPTIMSVLRGWSDGGREKAATAYALCFTMALEDAESFIFTNGLGPGAPVETADEPVQAVGTTPVNGGGGAISKPSPALNAPISIHWLCVNKIPLTLAERWIYDVLDRHGVPPSDIFLSKSQYVPHRFAFVGFSSLVAASQAARILNHRVVNGGRISATAFRDRQTGSTQPRNQTDLFERRYIGAQAQADLAPFEREKGLHPLHLAPSTSRDDVGDFLRQSIPRSKIGYIEVRRAGLNYIALADIADEESCRMAILDLDGAVLNGQAIRLAWLERNTHWKPPVSNSNDFRRKSTPPTLTEYDPSPTLLLEPISPPVAPRSSPQPPPPVDRDLERLSSLGLSQQMLESIEQMWRPISQAPQNSTDDSAPFQRSIDVSIDFGFLIQHEARAALKQNEVSPAYPEDPARQARYTAFLKAQAGESRDFYTVFFAQLDEFNASSRVFADKARSIVKASSMERGGSVDEAALKTEESV